MATKPSIVLVGGSFAPPAVYDLVVSRLKDSGFDVEVPQLPSIGRREGEPPTLADDVAHVHSVLERKSDEGKDVLIIGHSYGGVPTTEAIQGLSKADREKQGKEGGVVRILYTTAVLPELGQTAAEFFGGGFADFVVIDDEHWAHLDPEGYAKTFPILPFDEALKWAKKTREHSVATFAAPLTHPGYKDVPVSYLIAEEDTVITPEKQLQEIERIEKESGAKVDVHRVKTHHSGYIVSPEEVTEVIVKVAKLSS